MNQLNTPFIKLLNEQSRCIKQEDKIKKITKSYNKQLQESKDRYQKYLTVTICLFILILLLMYGNF